MKKILFIATVPISIKAFTLDFMRFLRDKGYDVSAAASKGPEADMIRGEGFRYHEITIPRDISLPGDVRAFRELKSLLIREKFDLVHTQTSKAGFIGRLAAKAASVPLVVHTAHDWPFHHLVSPVVRMFYVFLERIAARWCDAIIVDTKAVREHGLRYRVAPLEKIHQIYMGIDTERFYPYSQEDKDIFRQSIGIGPGKIVIGAISRLVPDKGMETFLSCAHAFKDREDIIFVIGGDGSLRTNLEREADGIGMKNKIIFTGQLNNVVPYLNAFDIFFLPTLREGFGVVFAEAQACGVPVVATRIPPLKEVVNDGRTGILVQSGDIAGFIDALQHLCEPAARKEMGIQARHYVQDNFRVEDINIKTLDLYKRLWELKYKTKTVS